MLTEWSKKDDIFSDKSLMKSHSNLVKIKGPFGKVCDYFESTKRIQKALLILMFEMSWWNRQLHLQWVMP